MKKQIVRKSWNDIDKNIDELLIKGSGLYISREILNELDYYLYPITFNGKIGFINSNADVIVATKYESIKGSFRTKDSYVWVKDSHGEGIIDSNGIEIIPCGDYKTVCLDQNEKMAIVRKHDFSWGIISLHNKEVVVEFGKYMWIDYENKFQHGLIRVKSNSKATTIQNFDKYGIEVGYNNNVKIESVKPSNEGWGLLDKYGREVLECKFDRLINLHEENGVMVVQCEFDCICSNVQGDEKKLIKIRSNHIPLIR